MPIIRLSCPHCSALVKGNRVFLGYTYTCPRCKQKSKIGFRENLAAASGYILILFAGLSGVTAIVEGAMFYFFPGRPLLADICIISAGILFWITVSAAFLARMSMMKRLKAWD